MWCRLETRVVGELIDSAIIERCINGNKLGLTMGAAHHTRIQVFTVVARAWITGLTVETAGVGILRHKVTGYILRYLFADF